MFQKMKVRTLRILPAVLVSVLLVTGVIYAWTEPPVAPPNGNVSAPLNVGSAGQYKLGNLMLNTEGTLANALLIPFGWVGIGTLTPTQPLDLNMTGRIANIQNPVDAQDAATKAYVDAAGGGGGSGLKVVKVDCPTQPLGSFMQILTCTADCGAGWWINQCVMGTEAGVADAFLSPSAYDSIRVASMNSSNIVETCKNKKQGSEKAMNDWDTKGGWDVWGEQSYSIKYLVFPTPPGGDAIGVLCSKQ